MGISTAQKPSVIVAAINEFIAVSIKKRKPRTIDHWDDRALPLGALLGIQFVRRFKWEWVSVVQHDFNDFKATGVFNVKRSMAIYPFHYVFGCLENRVYPKILLAFNMLEARKIPKLPAKSYTNVMDGVFHIVPLD